MMVCIQQHQICECCLHRQPAINNCPFCREPFNRKKVNVHRERKKTLELENMYKEKLNEVIKNKVSAVPLRKPLLLVSEVEEVSEVEKPEKKKKREGSKKPTKMLKKG